MATIDSVALRDGTERVPSAVSTTVLSGVNNRTRWRSSVNETQ